jgi:CubicO group peptidase (beta-lactamase class C family)
VRSRGGPRRLSRRSALRGIAAAGAALWTSKAARAAAPGFERAARALQDAVARGDIPGAVQHVRTRGEVLVERAFGLTKPVVAAAVMKLAETGALRVGDPVAAYIPEFAHARVLVKYDATTGAMPTRPARRQITLRDLLTHTAGIHHGHAEIDPVLGAIYKRPASTTTCAACSRTR